MVEASFLSALIGTAPGDSASILVSFKLLFNLGRISRLPSLFELIMVPFCVPRVSNGVGIFVRRCANGNLPKMDDDGIIKRNNIIFF